MRCQELLDVLTNEITGEVIEIFCDKEGSYTYEGIHLCKAHVKDFIRFVKVTLEIGEERYGEDLAGQTSEKEQFKTVKKKNRNHRIYYPSSRKAAYDR